MRSRSTNSWPKPSPALGYGFRESLPPVCSIHRSLSCAAILQAHMTVLHNPTQFHCYFASPHCCLYVPGDFFSLTTTTH